MDLTEIEGELIAIEKEIYEAVKEIILKREGAFSSHEGSCQPFVDIYMCKTCVKVEIDLPGIDKEDVEVTYINPFLFIKGIKKNPYEGRNVKYHCMECRFGNFQRIIEVPGAVNINDSKARLKDGVLCILLPMVGERRERGKSIPIEYV